MVNGQMQFQAASVQKIQMFKMIFFNKKSNINNIIKNTIDENFILIYLKKNRGKIIISHSSYTNTSTVI